LYLTGTENTIRRVTAETNYSCLMLKTQRFSSLFRHYAKYHGLRKDDLEYYFVNPLENEDTPETVHLQRGDTIIVRKRRKAEPAEPAADDDEFFKDMRELFEDEEHMDCTFLVHSDSADRGSNNDKKVSSNAGDNDDMDEESEDNKKNANLVEIRAHKCILTARAEYFKAFFRKGYTNGATGVASGQATFRESEECVIHVEPDFAPCHIRYMMEFIYTNRIQSIKEISTDDLLSLLHLSDRWLIRDLKRLVEHELIRNHMTIQSVARMYGATEEFHANRLSRACIDFIMDNLRQLAGNSSFEEEMKNYPLLCIPVLKAAAEMIPEGPSHKKQRLDHGSSTTAAATPSSSAAAGLGSSPVPDSDP
jgi:speckle-type POZ protein